MSAYVSGRLSKYVVIRGKMLVACPCLFLVRKSCVKMRLCHLPVNHIPNFDQPSCQCYCHSGDLEGGGRTHHNFLILPGKVGQPSNVKAICLTYNLEVNLEYRGQSSNSGL